MVSFIKNYQLRRHIMSTQEHELRKSPYLTRAKSKFSSANSLSSSPLNAHTYTHTHTHAHAPSNASTASASTNSHSHSHTHTHNAPAPQNALSGKKSPPNPDPLSCKTGNLKFLNFLNALQGCRNFNKPAKYPTFTRNQRYSYSDGSVDYRCQDISFRVSPAENEYGYVIHRLNLKNQIIKSDLLLDGKHFQLRNDEFVFQNNTNKISFGTGIGSQEEMIDQFYNDCDSPLSQTQTDSQFSPKRTRSDASTPKLSPMKEDETSEGNKLSLPQIIFGLSKEANSNSNVPLTLANGASFTSTTPAFSLYGAKSPNMSASSNSKISRIIPQKSDSFSMKRSNAFLSLNPSNFPQALKQSDIPNQSLSSLSPHAQTSPRALRFSSKLDLAKANQEANSGIRNQELSASSNSAMETTSDSIANKSDISTKPINALPQIIKPNVTRLTRSQSKSQMHLNGRNDKDDSKHVCGAKRKPEEVGCANFDQEKSRAFKKRK